MKPYTSALLSILTLLACCTPAAAFELGSCLIVEISEEASAADKHMGVVVAKSVFQKTAIAPKATTASATDFLEDDSSVTFEGSATQSSADTFSLQDTSTFKTSPFDTSSFSFE